MGTYADAQTEDAPPWLQDALSQRLKFVYGIVKDAFIEATKQAVKSRFAKYAPRDALPYIGQMRDIDRGWGYDEDGFRAQLAKPFSRARGQGTPAGMQQALNIAGYPNVVIKENWEVSVAPPPGIATSALAWARFWVLLYPPYPFGTVVIPTWDDAAIWQDGNVWTEGVQSDEIARVQRIVRKQKPKHMTAKILYVISGEAWGDPPSGLWGDDGPGVWGGQILEVDV